MIFFKALLTAMFSVGFGINFWGILDLILCLKDKDTSSNFCKQAIIDTLIGTGIIAMAMSLYTLFMTLGMS
jgi:hypothetical protein